MVIHIKPCSCDFSAKLLFTCLSQGNFLTLQPFPITKAVFFSSFRFFFCYPSPKSSKIVILGNSDENFKKVVIMLKTLLCLLLTCKRRSEDTTNVEVFLYDFLLLSKFSLNRKNWEILYSPNQPDSKRFCHYSHVLKAWYQFNMKLKLN